MLGVFVVICCVLRTCLLLQKDGPNVCVKKNTPKENTTDLQLTIECCPDFIEKNDTCHECSPGTFGKRCEEKCYLGKYGTGCRHECNCGPNQYCNSVDGCVCNLGFAGPNCSSECDASKHDVNCSQICNCTGSCDHVNSKCTGEVIRSSEKESNNNTKAHYVAVYLLIASLLTVLMILGVGIIKLKEVISRCYNTRQLSNQDWSDGNV